MSLLRLLRYVSLSHFKNEKIKGLLTILGMALGIAVYSGIRFASSNVFGSFETSTQILAGSQSRVIVSRGGPVQETEIKPLLEMEGVRALVPMSRRFVEVYDRGKNLGTAQILGVDVLKLGALGLVPESPSGELRSAFLKMLRPGNAAAVSARLSDTLSSDTFEILRDTQKVTLEKTILLPEQGVSQTYGGRIILMDIASYQELFGDFGKVDRLLVQTGKNFNEETFKKELEARAGGRLELITGEDRTRQGRKMTEAFNLNLQFLACVSLFVAMLLIYNSVSYAVLKRRREIGILQSMGVTPRMIFALITAESLTVGLIAALAGTLAGYGLSFLNIRLMTSSISGLYFPVEVSAVQFQPRVLAECLILGPALACLGALLPCLEIFKVTPRETFHYQNFETRFRKWLPILTGAGLCFLLLSLFFADTRWLSVSILLGFVSPAFLILGFVLLVPFSLNLLIHTSKSLFKNSGDLASYLALDHIQTTLQRNAVAVASAMIAVGMFLGMSTMIVSFRGTVDQWINHVTKADLFISSPYAISGKEGGYLPPELLEQLSRDPEVTEYDWIVSKHVRKEEREIKVNGVRFETLAEYDRLLYRTPVSNKEIQSWTARRDAALVSETFSNRFGLKEHDRVTLYGKKGPAEFEIVNIFYDYSSDQGVILIDDSSFQTLFGEPRKQGIALYLKDPARAAEVKSRIENTYKDHEIVVRENTALRREVMTIFDQTFRITKALQWIALIIAAFAILNTILMLTLERAREFGVLRALGGSSKLLTKMMTHEALLLGGASAAGGILVGLALSLILVFVINKFFFAWSVVFSYPWPIVLSTGGGILILSFLCGWLPARSFIRRMDAGMLRYE